MRWISLLYKDLREHAVAFISLALGFVLVLMMAFLQQSSGTFNMSTFQVVRFSLISLVPLIAFIVGNRLIVREFNGGTRKFVEGLPVHNYSPLLIKFLIGLFYILALCAVVVFIASMMAGAEEDITPQYVQLLLLKTGAIGCLIWSVVFFVSFTGRIRLVIYVVMGLALMYFLRKPGFDEAGFPPFAILDNDLFVFERDIFPWRDLIGTVLIALVFVIAGFVLALVNEGSIAEQLGKPVSRRDITAFVLLGLGGSIVYTTLQEKWDTQIYRLSGEHVIRGEQADVAISYLQQNNKLVATDLLNSLSDNITQLQSSIGIDQLPQVQIALNTDLEKTEIEPSMADGVIVTANFVEYDTFENSLLRSVAMHHLLLSLTNGRWDYESRHWLLDGLARWWSEGGEDAESSVNNSELFALAWLTKERMDPSLNPLLDWQSITDQHGFEGADALSYSAILYLATTKGTDIVIQLTADYVNEDISDTSLESVNRFLNQDTVRFMRITGLSLSDFTTDFITWLDTQAAAPAVMEFIESVPKIEGEIVSVFDENGANRLEASYNEAAGYSEGVPGNCVLRHQPTSAFTYETMIYTLERDRVACTTQGVAHSIDSPYAKGDRVYGLLEFESEKFHRPVPIWVGRIHIQ